MSKNKRKTCMSRRKRAITHPSSDRTVIEQARANKIIQECACECHQPGCNIMHFMACCEFCYESVVDL